MFYPLDAGRTRRPARAFPRASACEAFLVPAAGKRLARGLLGNVGEIVHFIRDFAFCRTPVEAKSCRQATIAPRDAAKAIPRRTEMVGGEGLEPPTFAV